MNFRLSLSLADQWYESVVHLGSRAPATQLQCTADRYFGHFISASLHKEGLQENPICSVKEDFIFLKDVVLIN